LESALTHESRSALPESFVRFLDSKSEGTLSGITWVEPNRDRFTAHYSRDGKPLEDKVFRYKSSLQQARLAQK
jgi:hypothetical protein